jgi:predicted ribosome quality control (RQC) complex YloA/Tae2 family protein
MTNSEDRVDVVTAAQLLGISAAGVRRRIQRGKLAAVQIDGRWYVALPDLEQEQVSRTSRNRPNIVTGGNVLTGLFPKDYEELDRDTAEQAQNTSGTTKGTAEQASRDSYVTALQAAYQQTIDTQREQIGDLRTELESRRREVEELHILLQREQSRSLTAPQEPRPAEPPQEPEQPGPAPIEEMETTRLADVQPPRRPWWKVWG